MGHLPSPDTKLGIYPHPHRHQMRHIPSQAPEWMFTCTAALLNLNVVVCVDDSEVDKKYYIS